MEIIDLERDNLITFGLEQVERYGKTYLYKDNKLVEELDLTNMSIHANNINGIKSHTFSYIKGLKKIILPKNLTIIGKNAFFNCQGLEEIIFNKSLHFIREYAFAYCNIKKLNLPENLWIIKEHAFKNNKIQNITFNKNLQNIYHEAFANNNISTVSIPESVQVLEPFFLGNQHTDNTTVFVSKKLKGKLNNYGNIVFIENDLEKLIEKASSFKQINNIYKTFPER